MNMNRFAKPMTVAAGLIFFCATHGLTLGQTAATSPVQSPKASSGSQPKKDSPPPDDFAGLDYTDEQKTDIAKIHRDTKLHEETVAKDQKLTQEQKDAMLVGYKRMEYGQVYRVLTPAQKKEVLRRIRSRRAADQVAQKKPPLQKSQR